ncbi:hypothetical protein CXB51_028833 [Gossypium anomalum]|uniref:Uncharacterized protein n=1 Tax=Gossypium anomalum TaxID=47600 RepID=A0A8J5YFA3_9ROSI|nr:hypothetical protein CXB51_028833 [Gossypium anomalum]
MQPPNHHHMAADGAQTMADFANGRELQLCPRRYGGHGLDVVRGYVGGRGDVRGERWWRTWVVRGGGGSAGQRESLKARRCRNWYFDLLRRSFREKRFVASIYSAGTLRKIELVISTYPTATSSGR